VLEVGAWQRRLAGMATAAITGLGLDLAVPGEVWQLQLELRQHRFGQTLPAMQAAEAAEDQRFIQGGLTQGTVERHRQQVEQHCATGE
jgi:hypothetical protein